MLEEISKRLSEFCEDMYNSECSFYGIGLWRPQKVFERCVRPDKLELYNILKFSKMILKHRRIKKEDFEHIDESLCSLINKTFFRR